MDTPANKGPVGTAAQAAKARAKKKPPSARRTGAMAAVEAAKSEQEKKVALAHLKIVRFEELIVPRVRRAVKALDVIGNLANRGAYTWTDEQSAKVVSAINAAAKRLVDKFTGEKQKKEEFNI